MNLFKKLFIHSLSRYVAALGMTIALALIYVSLNGTVIQMFINGFELAGFVTILIGGLMTTSYFGSFDTFGYSFGKVLNYKKNKGISFADYVEQKNISRKAQPLYFMPYYAVGTIILILSLIVDLFI